MFCPAWRQTPTISRSACPARAFPETSPAEAAEQKANVYRRGICARCALREDLTALMIDGANDPAAMTSIVEALCRVDRPASILTWKLSPESRRY